MSILVNFFQKITQFKTNKTGNIAIMFAISTVPLMLAVGLSMDYTAVSDSKTKLDIAMDSSSIAGIMAAKLFIANNTDPTLTGASLNSAAESAGRTKALNQFNSNTISDSRITNIVYKPKITVTQKDVTAISTYAADYKLAFGSFAGFSTYTVSNSATAAVDLSQYLDISIVMDVSGSMGIGADQTNIDLMKIGLNLQTDPISGLPIPNSGCEFACHVGGQNLEDLAHLMHIILRIDVMRAAIINMLAQARGLQSTPNNNQFSIYTFSNSLSTLQTATTDYTMLYSAMTTLGLSQVGGGTNFHYSIGTQLPPKLTLSQDGSASSKRKTHVIIVTDGVEDAVYNGGSDLNYVLWNGNGAPFSGSNIQAFDPTICDNVKATGATVSILHIQYTIPTNTTNPSYTYIRDNILPNAATTIQGCASDPSKYYRVDNSADIQNAAIAIFNNIAKPARLTN